MADFDPAKTHLEHWDGTIFQVLKAADPETGLIDWDPDATKAAYDAYDALQPPPPPPPPLPVVRTLIRKSTLIRRCHEAGKLTAVMAILDHPSNAYAKARWWAPDWPEVFADDPEMVAMLEAVGADVAVITAPEEQGA